MLKRMPWPVILQVIPELSAGGAERTVIDMAEAVKLGGGRALVLSAGGRLENELAAVGGELIRFPAKTKNPAAILFNAALMARIIRERGISLIHARSRAPAWSAFLAARRAKRCFVTTYHGIYNQESFVKAFYNSVMARGDAVICNSQYTARIVSERHPKAIDRVGVIYRGVDLERFNPEAVGSERVRALREAWGVAPEKRIVLLPARLTRWKGQKTLIEAAAEFRARGEHSDAVFVLAGDEQGRAAFRGELVGLIRALELESQVTIAGHCDDMPAAYKAASVTVLPSLEAEAFGRCAVEAQSMGCPVIASNIGAFPETITPEPGVLAPAVTGIGHAASGAAGDAEKRWLFEPGNVPGLCESLKFVLSMNQDALDSVRQRGIDRVRRIFSKSALQFQTLTVYDRLLGTQLAEVFEARTRG